MADDQDERFSEEERGDDIVAKAEKKMKGFKMFGNKFEEAQEMLEKAANLYKMGKCWMKAGNTYKRLSEVHLKLESPYDAATSLQEAANCFVKVNPPDGIACLLEAVDMFREMGKLPQAAKLHKQIGEMYEGESDMEKAIQHFTKSAEFYEAESQPAGAQPSFIKIAMLSAQVENYTLAVDTFEKLASMALDNPMLRYGAKDHLFKAGLCHFAAFQGLEKGPTEIRQHLERYQTMDVTFMDTREFRFLMELVDAFEKRDVDVFQRAVVEFDRIARLDDWKTAILLRIRNRLEKEPDVT